LYAGITPATAQASTGRRKARIRGGELVQEIDAFVECEAGEEVVDVLVQGGGEVAEEGRRAFGHVLRSLEEEKQDAKQEEDLEAELEVVREQMSRGSKRFDDPSPRLRCQGVHPSSHRPAEDPVNLPLSNGLREN
jgi:polyhydroxyalkanoate synthesis regulator phasin